jgi:hypothetical protein
MSAAAVCASASIGASSWCETTSGVRAGGQIRWRATKATAADIAVLRDRATAAFGGDVKALFISFNGFSDECLTAVNARAAAERVILMDGMDLRSILNADIAFEVLLDEKQAYAVREQRAYVSAREIVLARVDSGRGR